MMSATPAQLNGKTLTEGGAGQKVLAGIGGDGPAFTRLAQHLLLDAGGGGERFADRVWTGCAGAVAAEDFLGVSEGSQRD